MNQSSTLIVNAINNFDEFGEHVQVSASHELIELVSEQLYQSPLKAIEELVVNAYNADASRSHIPCLQSHTRFYIQVSTLLLPLCRFFDRGSDVFLVDYPGRQR